MLDVVDHPASGRRGLMARRKAERPAEGGVRRAKTNAVAAYLTALKAPKVPARSRAALEKRRAQIEQWIAEEPSPIREVELNAGQHARPLGGRGRLRDGT